MSFFDSVFSLRRALSFRGARRPKPPAATRRRPLLEQLEDRVTPSTAVTFVDDNWADLSRNSGAPQIGDIIQNLNDAINPGGVTASYGFTGFGTVVTNAPGTAPGAATINDAIANTNTGGTVNVLEGTYAENNDTILIDKSITLSGSNAAISPNTGSRVAEATITTQGLNDPSGLGTAVELEGGGLTATIQGFTFDGTSSPVNDYSAGNTVTLRNNIFQDVQSHGMFFETPTLTLDNNLFTGGDYGTEDTVQVGVSSNTHSGSDVRAPVTITNNVWNGVNTSALNLSDVSGTVTGNQFLNVVYYGVLVANDSGNLSITGNTFNGVSNPDPADVPTYGAGVRFYTPLITAPVTVTGNTFENSYIGVAIRRDSAVGGQPADITGMPIDVHGNTFTNDTWAIYQDALGTLDVTAGNTFNGVNSAGATLPQLYAIEDQIFDGLDEAGRGLVRLRAGNVYVTPMSGSIQRGVDLASADDTVNVEAGTYTNTTSGGDTVVNVDKPLTVQGTDGAAATIIDGDSATDNYYVVIISASDVTLSGFTITNPLYSGTADASGVLIESMTNNAPLTGVNVTGNVIHDIGVLDRAGAFATLGVNVEGVNPGSGVSDSTIQDNTIYNIGNADPTSFAVGVLTAGDVNMEVNNVSISGNTIYNVSNASLAAGVDVGYGSENVTVDDNTVGLNGSSAGPVGVGIRTGSGVFGPVTISDDTVENASVAGVQLDSPFSQTVTGGTYEADAVGVEVQNGTATLQDLNLSSDGTGFTASNVAALTLSDLTLTGDTQGGTISNVTTVNDTPTTGGTGVTTTITGSFFQSGTNQAVDYTGVQSLNVTGSVGGDVFEVTPAAATTITVHGGLPTPPASPGDVLNVTLAGATDPVLNDSYSSSSGYSGGWTVGNRAAVNFDGIETLSPSGPEVAVLKTSGELDLLTPGTNAKVEISPAGSIRAVVATIDASFNNDIFAISELPGYAGTLWEYSDASGWMEISSGSFAQISATTNASGQAVVFGVLADGSLWEQDPAGAGRDVGWTELSPAGTIRSVGAVTDSTGAVVAVAISNLPGYAGTVWEHTDASGWQEESSGSFTQVSADLNASGQAIIFGMLSDGSLWEQDPAGAGLNVGWTERSGASNVLSVTAGGVGDEAFVIETNHNVYRLTPSGLTQLSSNGTVESVSATATQGQDEVFAVMTDGSLWEYSPNFPGNHFEEILSGGVASSAVAPRIPT